MLYKGVKYACGTCIKGHRSSQCTHAERPLFEIRKKGRPVTQCSLCRDLRKTKQVHIKCACTHKSTKASAVVPDIRDKCTCSDVNYDHHLPTIKLDDSTGCATHHINTVTRGGDESFTSLLPLSSSSMIQQQQQQQQPSSMIDTSFAWAAFLTTPSQDDPLLATTTTTTNDNIIDLGFLFHKPTSRRFLDGQPQSPRKKSMKKQYPHQQQQQPIMTSSSTSTTTTIDNTTCLTHSMLPFMDMGLSSSTSSSSTSSSCSDGGGDMLSTDVAMLLDDVLNHHYQADLTTAATTTNLEVTHTNNNNNNFGGGAPTDTPQIQFPCSDYCGMYPAICRSKHTATGPGESVLITVTPINTTSAEATNVRTRLATCYSSSDSCYCPGCLVHPLPDTFWQHDPLVFSNTSTASSTYSTSDDEDHHHQPAALLLG